MVGPSTVAGRRAGQPGDPGLGGAARVLPAGGRLSARGRESARADPAGGPRGAPVGAAWRSRPPAGGADRGHGAGAVHLERPGGGLLGLRRPPPGRDSGYVAGPGDRGPGARGAGRRHGGRHRGPRAGGTMAFSAGRPGRDDGGAAVDRVRVVGGHEHRRHAGPGRRQHVLRRTSRGAEPVVGRPGLAGPGLHDRYGGPSHHGVRGFLRPGHGRHRCGGLGTVARAGAGRPAAGPERRLHGLRHHRHPGPALS